MTRHCELCKAPTKKTCVGCSRVAYCSKKCQSEHWIFHILECDTPGREITTADHLAAVIYDPQSQNPTTSVHFHDPAMHDWGFFKASTNEDKRALLSVYADLFRRLGVKPSTAHKWRVQGCLYTRIIDAYKQAGITTSNPNFTWLGQHPEYFKIRTTYASLQFGRKFDLAELVCAHIGLQSGDEGRERVANWSDHQYDCFTFYIVVFNGNNLPVECPGLWLRFGCCTVNDDRWRLLLKEIYPLLIRKCTFEEFVDAYSTSSLITLMDKKGLKKLRSGMPPEFEVVLSQSPSRIPAVWALKSFVTYPAESFDRSVLDHFGFANCTDSTESNRLKHYYAKVFDEWKVPPLMLQRAAEQDIIFDLITALRAAKLSKSERRFLQRVLTTQNQAKYGGKLPVFNDATSKESA
ncbi:hypothetical protein SISSUDRAFT_1044082 [Sistotremastrum suecicum HHB10207 ss-3]|uniref:MYND-type domain-containing protein n=1 Tax=Sistotremastrum suecicum HHB10207 ss-3 TaxID=1314776 RepID=A0A166FDY6_9AGAM|nr:hypothetical protein SISSUDRAFT_1044082 [Sistotremastrum suecicum HHB10207 ss-3]